jgi:hypothetical protein
VEASSLLLASSIRSSVGLIFIIVTLAWLGCVALTLLESACRERNCERRFPATTALQFSHHGDIPAPSDDIVELAKYWQAYLHSFIDPTEVALAVLF